MKRVARPYRTFPSLLKALTILRLRFALEHRSISSRYATRASYASPTGAPSQQSRKRLLPSVNSMCDPYAASIPLIDYNSTHCAVITCHFSAFRLLLAPCTPWTLSSLDFPRVLSVAACNAVEPFNEHVGQERKACVSHSRCMAVQSWRLSPNLKLHIELLTIQPHLTWNKTAGREYIKSYPIPIGSW